MVERGGNGRIIAQPAKRLTQKHLEKLVRGNIDAEKAILMTDEFLAYARMSRILPHQTVNHRYEYVNGKIHTNSIESFWALLKRGIIGQYHKVSAKHLAKYVVEFSYRHNNRHLINLFDETLLRAVGGTK